MAAQHLVGLGIYHQFHQRTFLAFGQGQLHRTETALEGLHLVTSVARLFFSQADGADVRQAEHRRRDHLVVHRAILFWLEQASRNGHAFCQGYRCQLHTPDHVAKSED
ncbi:hypothetical protein D3C71_1827970 [compost metagenome]